MRSLEMQANYTTDQHLCDEEAEETAGCQDWSGSSGWQVPMVVQLHSSAAPLGGRSRTARPMLV